MDARELVLVAGDIARFGFGELADVFAKVFLFCRGYAKSTALTLASGRGLGLGRSKQRSYLEQNKVLADGEGEGGSV